MNRPTLEVKITENSLKPTTIKTQVGSPTNTIADSTNGRVNIRCRVEEASCSLKDGVKEHYIITLSNHGESHHLNQKDQAIHIKSIELVFDNTDRVIDKNINYTFDRFTPKQTNIVSGQADLGDLVYGIRDACLKEPTAIRSTKDTEIRMVCLDNRPPTNGYPIWSAQYHNTLDGSLGEDPLSGREHRLNGGTMVMWEVIVTDVNRAAYIDFDPEPPMDPKWLLLTGQDLGKNKNVLSERSPRYKELIKSIGVMGWRTKPDGTDTPHDRPGEKGMLWYWLMGESRWETWNHKDDLFDLPPSARHLGWLSWPDQHWNDGHYNMGYNYTYSMFRIWLESPRGQLKDLAWFAFSRWAKWELTSALVWSNPSSKYDHKGWRHYEKSHRGPSSQYVGAQYHPSTYKQYTESILIAGSVYGDTLGWEWAKEGRDEHLSALKKMDYENWDGNWGCRIPGWGMINHIAAYKWTDDQEHRDLAIKTGKNCLEICKQPSRIAREIDPKWIDINLGVPYWENPKQTHPQGAYTIFSWSKLVEGLIRCVVYGDMDTADKYQFKQKIKQCAEFGAENFVHDLGGWTTCTYRATPDRIPANYNNGMGLSNAPDTAAFSLPWFLTVMGYGAIALNSKSCEDAFTKLYRHYCENIDWSPSISYEYWEGNVTQAKELDDTIILSVNTDLNDVIVGTHQIRVAVTHPDNTELFSTVLPIGDIRDTPVPNSIWIEKVNTPKPILDAINNNEPLTFWICGTDSNDIKSHKDKAIKKTRYLGNRPDPSRPFSWDSGRHHNTWYKITGPTLYHGDLPAFFSYLIKNK